METQLAKFGDDKFFIKIKTVKVDPKTGEAHKYWNTTPIIPDIPQGKRAKWNAQNQEWDYLDLPPPPPPITEEETAEETVTETQTSEASS